ncbi:MAG TPA: zinc-binding alcohol dehydrogenase [Actinomycetota bacterium]|nr:zinc-binding alcohol dehydrogenase [Actinomycetota bacterium]
MIDLEAAAGARRWGARAERARAVRFLGPREVDLEEVELPPPGPGEVVVATRTSGISAGTEMLAYRGLLDPALPLDERLPALGGTFRYPFRYGYSAVGVVERSRSDRPEGSIVFAFHPHQDRFVVRSEDVIALDGVDPDAATLLPQVETALQVRLDVGEATGRTIVVTGLGVVGLLTAALLARAGADVLGADPLPWRRRAAAGFGVRTTDPGETADAVARATRRAGADVVVEASGDPGALGPALGLLRHEGTAVVASWYGTRPVALPLGGAFHRRRLSIVSSQVSTIPARLADRWDLPRRRRAALGLLRDLPVASLLTHRFPFERAAEAYAAIDRGEEGLLHAVLEYP